MTPQRDGRFLCAGGVLFDGQGRVLLRRPAKSYGGYVWTYPKGRLDEGESFEQAALREVLEESGWDAEPGAQVPGPDDGDFVGDTSFTRFFVMRPIAQVQQPDSETAELRWVTVEEARVLIAETRTATGVKRDLAVLEGAVGVWEGGSVHGP